ncbi:MAG TPA: MBOAT family O-acyltransferase [Patescibacteria group bacterium]|nr:MBOAT family O-acyltransferase [Patescibacteria group bacterium]
MTFDSLTFVVFFIAVVAMFNLPGLSWSARKSVLLGASFLFYGAWNPPFLLLLIGSATVDWWLALRMAQARSNRRKPWLIVSLVANLGLLGLFKYGDFLRDNTQTLLALVGIDWQPATFDILLPVGISFYTFQSLSYCIDVYRGEVRVQKSLRDYLLFVGFFPQLVAGPIVRYHDFSAQLHTPRRTTVDGFTLGLSLLLIGLFEKIVLADSVFAPVADPIFKAGGTVDTASAWTGTIAFAGQIFCDFAGYSTCAIGCAAMLGFWLPDNFRSPYAASGFSDFWRRWHLSLSTWLRDYLYVPLGGNRGGSLLTLRNLMLTMLLGGLWHGAAWTFVAWGAFHGLMLVLERVSEPAIAATSRLLGGLGTLLGGLLTLLGVLVAWVWFRAPDFTHAAQIHAAMFVPDDTSGPISAEAKIAWIAFGLMWSMHWLWRHHDLRRWLRQRGAATLGLIWATLIVAIVLSPGVSRAFIYFQF